MRPPDAFCMSLYCQKEKWAILTPSTLPYPFECLNLQAQCFRTCHLSSVTYQNISKLPPLFLMVSWIKHTPKMRNTAKSDICLSFPSLSDIRKITKKCQKIPTYYLQMIQVNGKSYLPMADTYAPEYRLGLNMLSQPTSTQCMHCASYPILLLSCLSISSLCLANYGIMCR